MAYVLGLGASEAADPAVIQRLRLNYPILKQQLLAEAQRLTEPPSWWQRAKAAVSTENLDANAPAGQSLLNAIQRYDETMAQVLAGDYGKAEQLIKNMQDAVKIWGPDNDRPWSGLMQGIIDDLKKLPRQIAKTAAQLVTQMAEGAVEGAGPWWTLGTLAVVGLVGYVGFKLMTSSSFAGNVAALRRNPRARRKNPRLRHKKPRFSEKELVLRRLGWERRIRQEPDPQVRAWIYTELEAVDRALAALRAGGKR